MAIWILWVFSNNIDVSFASINIVAQIHKFHIALIIGPYLYNIHIHTAQHQTLNVSAYPPSNTKP